MKSIIKRNINSTFHNPVSIWANINKGVKCVSIAQKYYDIYGNWSKWFIFNRKRVHKKHI